METNLRTNKSFKNLAFFSKEVIVQCPHCKQRAHVLTDFGKCSVPYPMFNVKSKFRCSNCYKAIDETVWHGPVIIYPLNAKCGQCGASLENEQRLVNCYQAKMKVCCKVCNHEKFYQTKYKLTYANNNQATDPYFGLQLWLQTPVDENIFWAYNYDHLDYLKNYVSAKLREAQSGGKHSLAWKLPNFIKVAKNRDRILQAIARLEKKARPNV